MLKCLNSQLFSSSNFVFCEILSCIPPSLSFFSPVPTLQPMALDMLCRHFLLPLSTIVVEHIYSNDFFLWGSYGQLWAPVCKYCHYFMSCAITVQTHAYFGGKVSYIAGWLQTHYVARVTLNFWSFYFSLSTAGISNGSLHLVYVVSGTECRVLWMLCKCSTS